MNNSEVYADYLSESIISTLRNLGINANYEEMEKGISIIIDMSIINKISIDFVDAINGFIYAENNVSTVAPTTEINSEIARLSEENNMLKNELKKFHNAEIAIRKEALKINLHGKIARQTETLLKNGKSGKYLFS